jgi:hypothetical protein
MLAPSILQFILLAAVGVLIPYWIIRLAVRHGVMDAQKRQGKQQKQSDGWLPDTDSNASAGGGQLQ